MANVQSQTAFITQVLSYVFHPLGWGSCRNIIYPSRCINGDVDMALPPIQEKFLEVLSLGSGSCRNIVYPSGWVSGDLGWALPVIQEKLLVELPL